MKNELETRIQAMRIYEFYRHREREMVRGMSQADWDDPQKIKMIATMQKRRAMAGRILKIGRIDVNDE